MKGPLICGNKAGGAKKEILKYLQNIEDDESAQKPCNIKYGC